MKGILKNLAIIMLALGILGIILGISVGLYHNDTSVKTQTAGQPGLEQDGQTIDEHEQLDRLEGDNGLLQNNPLSGILIWHNLHTTFLAAGSLLTTLSVVLFLISIKMTIE